MDRAVGSEVWLERRKFPDSAHYSAQAMYLGEDEHGVWAGAHPDHLVLKGEDDSFRGQQTVVWLVPHDDWFMVHYISGHHSLDIYIDIATPAEWTDRGARVIDLDLDVVVWKDSDGRGAELIDQDEFDEHRIDLAYPSHLVVGARRAGDDVLARASSRVAPFTMATASPWFDALARLPPT